MMYTDSFSATKSTLSVSSVSTKVSKALNIGSVTVAALDRLIPGASYL